MDWEKILFNPFVFHFFKGTPTPWILFRTQQNLVDKEFPEIDFATYPPTLEWSIWYSQSNMIYSAYNDVWQIS